MVIGYNSAVAPLVLQTPNGPWGPLPCHHCYNRFPVSELVTHNCPRRSNQVLNPRYEQTLPLREYNGGISVAGSSVGSGPTPASSVPTTPTSTSGGSATSESQTAYLMPALAERPPSHGSAGSNLSGDRSQRRDQIKSQAKNNKAKDGRDEVVDSIRDLEDLIEAFAGIQIIGEPLKSGNHKTSGLAWRKNDILTTVYDVLSLFLEDEVIEAYELGKDVGEILNRRLVVHRMRKESGNALLGGVSKGACIKSQKSAQGFSCIAHGRPDYNECGKTQLRTSVREKLARLYERLEQDDDVMKCE